MVLCFQNWIWIELDLGKIHLCALGEIKNFLVPSFYFWGYLIDFLMSVFLKGQNCFSQPDKRVKVTGMIKWLKILIKVKPTNKTKMFEIYKCLMCNFYFQVSAHLPTYVYLEGTGNWQKPRQERKSYHFHTTALQIRKVRAHLHHEEEVLISKYKFSPPYSYSTTRNTIFSTNLLILAQW